MAGVLFRAAATDFSLLYIVQTGSGAHPAYYPMGTWVSRLVRKLTTHLPSTVEIHPFVCMESPLINLVPRQLYLLLIPARLRNATKSIPTKMRIPCFLNNTSRVTATKTEWAGKSDHGVGSQASSTLPLLRFCPTPSATNEKDKQRHIRLWCQKMECEVTSRCFHMLIRMLELFCLTDNIFIFVV
jgi:hypothetical protein